MPLHVLPRAKKSPVVRKKATKAVVRPKATARKKVVRPRAVKKHR